MTVPRLSFVRLTPHDPTVPLLVVGPSLGTAVETLWRPTAELLPGVEVVGWDLPGHGESPRPTEPFTVADLASGVADLTSTLRADRPSGNRAVVAGVSVGGATTLSLGVDHSGVADGLVAICSGAALGEEKAWNERAAHVREHGTASMVEGSRGRWFGPGFVEAHPDTAQALLDTLADADAEGYAATCEALGRYDVSADLPSIAEPVLMLNGENDVVAPPEFGTRVADAVRNGRAEALPGVGHLAPSEDPQATAAAITTFLREVADR